VKKVWRVHSGASIVLMCGTVAVIRFGHSSTDFAEFRNLGGPVFCMLNEVK